MNIEELQELEERYSTEAHYARTSAIREENLKLLEVVRMAMTSVEVKLPASESSKKLDTKERKFTLQVTARRTGSNEVEGKDWLDPQDFATFLNERFTVARDAYYGLDAYNKNAGQEILEVKVLAPPKKRVLRLSRPDDETIEYHVGRKFIASANHDEHGWSGMATLEGAMERVAKVMGMTLKEVE